MVLRSAPVYRSHIAALVGEGELAVAEPVEARSQSEVAYQRILGRIVSLEMAPGSVVNEAQLREELKIGLTDLARITEVRVVLEAHAARLAAEKLSTGDRDLIEELLELVGRGYVTDQRDLMQLDQQIHRTIYRAARNPFLEATLERYFNLSLRLWYLVLDRDVRLREAVDEHVELLHAILAGEGERAEAIMRRHVTGFEREIRKVLVEG